MKFNVKKTYRVKGQGEIVRVRPVGIEINEEGKPSLRVAVTRRVPVEIRTRVEALR